MRHTYTIKTADGQNTVYYERVEIRISNYLYTCGYTPSVELKTVTDAKRYARENKISVLILLYSDSSIVGGISYEPQGVCFRTVLEWCNKNKHIK